MTEISQALDQLSFDPEISPYLVLKENVETGERHYVIEASDLHMLGKLVRYMKATQVIETGSLTGSSTLFLESLGVEVWSIDAGAMLKDGKPGAALHAFPSYYKPHFVYGVGEKKIPHIPKHKIWVFFHDSDHSYQNVLRELIAAWKHGASAFACHDLFHCKEQGCEAAWDEFITRYHLSSCSFKTDSTLGLGIAVRMT